MTDGAPLRRLADRLHRRRILQRRDVARLAPEVGRADHAAHDLRAPRLRQVAGEEDALGLERLAHLPLHALGELLPQGLARGVPRLQDYEADDRLALHGMRNAHGRRFSNGRMTDEDGFHLRGAEALAGDLQRVVRTALEEPEALVVDVGPVAVHPDVRPARPVRLLVTLRVLPEALGHAGPRLRDDELAHLAAHGPPLVVVDVGGHAGDRPRERARLD